MKKVYIILIAGGAFIASCGNGKNSGTDSTTTTVDTSMTGINPDTIPAADVPAGAPNPGEDSSRYGTGTQDSSRNRRPQ
ncbi:MAG: hypothetical protein H6Q26_2702 [Bacteroidetes bacterium]|uniref:hypothetical protein n=1 Tax=unclassified Chitinophaga TaxID=2619133 RepID=UPI0009D4D906|nr:MULTISPECIES: hypothetical protein [unclassified Chitinophaga]MBP1652545.1 hypothetical protein [Bacteroidota bacterium]OMP78747.1 hypothetical protein BW716_13650 [[Flexibacter] sp. ATCC 35208]WPV64992.1 hypothetical protein QQL36_24615 [Chitinophaga sp. LS1]